MPSSIIIGITSSFRRLVNIFQDLYAIYEILQVLETFPTFIYDILIYKRKRKSGLSVKLADVSVEFRYYSHMTADKTTLLCNAASPARRRSIVRLRQASSALKEVRVSTLELFKIKPTAGKMNGGERRARRPLPASCATLTSHASCVAGASEEALAHPLTV